jgi:hypothetical protein
VLSLSLPLSTFLSASLCLFLCTVQYLILTILYIFSLSPYLFLPFSMHHSVSFFVSQCLFSEYFPLSLSLSAILLCITLSLFFYLILSPPAISRSPTFSNRFISLSLYRFLSISFSLLSPYLSFFLVSLLISLFNFVFLCISTSSILSLILSFYVSHPLPSCP